MATTSEVKAGLDDIAKTIRTERQTCAAAKARLKAARGNLDLIPATFKGVLDQVTAYKSVDPFESVTKAELALLTAEFIALRAATDKAITDLASITEF